MAVEMVAPCKRSAAVCTGERPLARVLSLVSGKALPRRKRPVAHIALVWPRTPAGVREHVGDEMLLPRESPCAKIARERPHAAVHPQVPDTLARSREPLSAHITVVQQRPLLPVSFFLPWQDIALEPIVPQVLVVSVLVDDECEILAKLP